MVHVSLHENTNGALTVPLLALNVLCAFWDAGTQSYVGVLVHGGQRYFDELYHASS